MRMRKGAIITTWKYKEYVAIFRDGNKTTRCFKYTNTNGKFASMIRDPLNWVEDCEPVTVPRGATFKTIYGEPVLWDAMNLLEHKIKSEGW